MSEIHDFSDEPDVAGVPEHVADDWQPEGYETPEYDETEPLEGDTHDHEEG